MGWRLRKSINLGLGFRINLSKSGIGYSWGFPGYRVTKMANGGNRTTYSLPGTGISYVEQNGGSKGSGKNQERSDGLYTGEVENYTNIPIEDIQKNDPILSRINKVASLNRWANLLLFSILLVGWVPAFSLTFIAGIVIKIVIATKMKIKLYYEFDEESRRMYDALKEVLILLSTNKKIWQISSSTRVFNTKYNAGAGSNVDRNNAFVTTKMPWYIKTNLDIYGLNLKNEKMLFTPDRLIVFRPLRKAFGCKYNDMFMGIDTKRFVESERVYKDSEIVDYTWYYTNKNGGRDLRFSNNKKIPVCKYGEITIKSPNGIHTVIEYSNHGLNEEIQQSLILFGNKFNKILDQTRAAERKVASGEEKSKPEKKTESISNEKKIISSVDELLTASQIKEISKEGKKTEVVNKPIEYKLPRISVLKDEESKSIEPFIEKMKGKKELLIPLGFKNEEYILEGINTMPNMLIGGTVMSGKTAYLNTLIASMLLVKKPDELKLMIYDSKRVDYSIFNTIPHLLVPIITDPRRFSIALKNICYEIERRQDALSQTSCKNIDMYNKKNEDGNQIPSIVVIIDDFSAFNNNEEINSSIENITANGWNVNVYVIVACNHPSAAVIPTVSKANFPARLSFKVASSQASQIILDEPGAEKLSGYGNALYSSRMNDKILKIKVPFISDSDIANIVEECSKQIKPVYSSEFLNNKQEVEEMNIDEYDDPIYNEVVEFAVRAGKISASLIQRKYRLGYNRAARIIDLLEERGIIGPANGDKPREVLVKFESDGE